MNRLKLILVNILTVMFLFASGGLFASDRTDGKLTKPKGLNDYEQEAYRLFINKIDLPLNNRGKIADVTVDGKSLGRFDGKGVIYSSGFMMSGVTNGQMWANAVASSSRIEDYVPGAIIPGDTTHYLNPGLYILKSSDPPFGESWQKWTEAVEAGAYFYDGDGDGVYNPVDKNGNGEWDPDEDAPDLLGDETVWCVYNDGLKASDRADGFRDVHPQGIEIRQTVWAYATSGDLGNIVFVRYSIVNRGTVANVIDSVYFGVWADPDLGDYLDDLVGSDRDLNAGYVYNDGDDKEFGSNPPAFLIDFFQGPWEYTGNNDDYALNVRGPLLGVDTIRGAKNLPLTSFVHYMQSHPTQGDPDNKVQARNYLLGLNQAGRVVDPCNWEFGVVLGEDCSTIDGHFMYSGDPVALHGWINTFPTDQRQMSNTGPFKLEKDKPVDIVVAYVVGRSKTALTSVTKAKQIDRTAQVVYLNNFNYPAPPKPIQPIVKTEDNAIELIWNTSKQVTYRSIGNGFDMRFEGFVVNMYENGTTAEQEGGVQNRVTVARYDLNNDIDNVIIEDGITLERSLYYEKGTQLDSLTYADPQKGWIKLRIETDPFTKGPIIKGKPYFISITSFALNYDEIQRLDAANFLIPGTAAIGVVSNIPVIIHDSTSIAGIVPGKDTYTPYRENVNTKHVAGGAEAKVTYSVYNKDAIKNHTYEVGFFLDSLSSLYSLYYYVKDRNTDTILGDSLKNYNDEAGVRAMYDGVTLNVEWKDPGLKQATFTSGGSWAKPLNRTDTTGAFYVGSDREGAHGVPLITSNTTKAVRASDLRRIEIRFGTHGKAYRYTSGIVNGHITQKLFYGGFVDNKGFVDVPFTAWIKDDKFGEERQLAVAFTENGFDTTLGRSDAKWNPGSDIGITKEYIIVFRSDYSDNPDNLVYTSIPTSTNWNNWPQIDRDGYVLPNNDPNYIVTDSMRFIAKQPYFDALAVIGIETVSNDVNFVPTDGTLEVPINYVLTPSDIYTYNVKLDLDDNEAQSEFDKVNVYPNPLFAYNSVDSYKYGSSYSSDSPHITFTNLPKEVTISIYTLSGVKIREISKNDNNPFLDWDLKNYDGLRAASGMYIAVVHSPKYGDKVLKFAIIMPQKQIQRY